jgi:DNA-binding transcriptional ArsR family regulator
MGANRAAQPATSRADARLTRAHSFDKTRIMEKKNAIAALAGLAQESRLDVFRLLVEQGPEGMPAGAIAERLSMPNATLSFHLKELLHARLITGRHAGRFIYYAPNFETVDRLVGYLTENCCRGASCVVACVPSPKSRRKA